MLAEIDNLEIHVIVNDELDPISPSVNPAVQVASSFMGIPLSPLDHDSDRGGAQMEMRMENICCAAHGISLLLVGHLLFSAGFVYLTAMKPDCHQRRQKAPFPL